MSETFFIENTELGRALDTIKNNKPIVKSPILISASTTLSVRQFIQAIVNGIVCDISAGSVTLTTPSAAEIQAALQFSKLQQVNFIINAYAPTTPNPNLVNMVGGTGITIGGFTSITPQNKVNVTFSCQSVSPPTFIFFV